MTAEILITAEQIADRDSWEQRFFLGECSLADALMMLLHDGIPPSPSLVKQLEWAFMAYQDGTYDDLAIPFGCAESKREKQKNIHETTRLNVKFHVKSFNEQGYPILNPNTWGDKESAFTKTADLLKNVSASTAFAMYYDKDIKKRKPHRPTK